MTPLATSALECILGVDNKVGRRGAATPATALDKRRTDLLMPALDPMGVRWAPALDPNPRLYPFDATLQPEAI